MKISFRLYNQLQSSFFNLIEGDKETQQTKGLGLLLAKSEIALRAFLDIHQIKEVANIDDLKEFSKIIINCEPTSKSDRAYRADIVLRFYKNGAPCKALIIEAKSITSNISPLVAQQQLERYIHNEVFEELKEFKDNIVGVTLTKYEGVSEAKKVLPLTWNAIISAFYKSEKEKDLLLNDYFNFITNIRGAMKFYERDVYSIPSAEWSNKAVQSFKIYECPNRGQYIIKYRPLYITFRKSGGGEMERLYKIDNIIIFNPKQDLGSFYEDSSYSEGLKLRVRGYIDFLWNNGIWPENHLPSEEKQFFILSETQNIDLNHRPKPRKNNAYRKYYSLHQLINTHEVL